MRKFAIAAIAAGALLLTGCSGHMSDERAPVSDEKGYVISDGDISTFTVTLPSGRIVECVAVTYSGSALACWEVGGR